MNNRTPNNAGLNPAASPQRIAGHGVRRLNNRPLIILGGIALVSLGLIAYVAVERGKPQTKTEADDHGGNATQYAQAMTGDRLGGTVPRASVAPLPPSVVPAVMTMATPAPSPTPDDLTRRRQAAFLAALDARPGVDGAFAQIAQQRAQQKAQQLTPQQVAMVQRADPNNAQDALDEYRRQLAQAQGLAGNGATDPNRLSNFNGPKNRWDLNTRVEPPRTPYVLQTGSVIPAVLITATDSDLPGSITAQVSEDVYDSPSGRFLLIPKGAKLFGEYVSGSGIGYGQNRVFVAWQRIIFPNGHTMDIGAMPGADQQGQSGFHDSVDSHWLRTFGSSLLMSAITAGVTISQPQNAYGGNGVSASQALSESLGQNLGNASSMLLQRNLNVPPTIKVRAGYKFNVTAVKDLTFDQPYYVPDYNR